MLVDVDVGVAASQCVHVPLFALAAMLPIPWRKVAKGGCDLLKATVGTLDTSVGRSITFCARGLPKRPASFCILFIVVFVGSVLVACCVVCVLRSDPMLL